MQYQSVLLEKSWVSEPSNIHLAREAIRDPVQRYAAEEADMIGLAIGEACANAVEHGSPSGAKNRFFVRCYLEAFSTLVFEVEDEGPTFALEQIPEPDPFDLDAEGGRGLFIIRYVMDEVELDSTEHGLIVRMVKRCPCLAV